MSFFLDKELYVAGNRRLIIQIGSKKNKWLPRVNEFESTWETGSNKNIIILKIYELSVR